MRERWKQNHKVDTEKWKWNRERRRSDNGGGGRELISPSNSVAPWRYTQLHSLPDVHYRLPSIDYPYPHSSPRCHFCITDEREHIEWIRHNERREEKDRRRAESVLAREGQSFFFFFFNYKFFSSYYCSPLSFPFLCCTTVTYYSHSHLGSLGTHTLTAHSAIYHELHKRDVRVSKRYRFDARGPATHGAAHAAVPSRLLCIYSNYVTSRIHCSPHHSLPEAPELWRACSSDAEVERATRMAQPPVTCRLFSFL